MYLQALAGCEKVLGRNHSSTLTTVNNLGSFYGKRGRLPDMLELVIEWGRNSIAFFGAHGRLLLQVSNDTSAQKAFLGQHAYDGGSTVCTRCNECGGVITASGGRTVC